MINAFDISEFRLIAIHLYVSVAVYQSGAVGSTRRRSDIDFLRGGIELHRF